MNSSTDDKATVYIHKMFGGDSRRHTPYLGRWCATLHVGRYKYAVSNGMETFVREHSPEPGHYLAFSPDHDTRGGDEAQASIVFEVVAPEPILRTGGRLHRVSDVSGNDVFVVPDARP